MANASPLTIDMREFDLRLNLLNEQEKREAKHAMTINTLDLLKESGNLAPVDEGTMIRSGTTRVSEVAGEIVGEVGYNTPYATRVHYEMAPAPFAKMQPGPRTRAKMGTEFGPAGGMYLQRPLVGKMKRYSQAIASHLKRTVMRGS